MTSYLQDDLDVGHVIYAIPQQPKCVENAQLHPRQTLFGNCAPIDHTYEADNALLLDHRFAAIKLIGNHFGFD